MKSLEALKTDRTVFSIGQALGDGWNLVSKFLGFYILGGVIAVVIAFGVGIIPFAGSLANNLLISPCLMGGAIYVTWQISKGNGWADFADMFKGFKYLQPIFISTLIQTAVTTLLSVVIFYNFLPQFIELYEKSQGVDAFTRQEQLGREFLRLFTGDFMISLAILMVVLLFISALWAFKTHFIIIYNMQAWPAMEMSRRIARHNLWQLIGFFIVMGFIIIISAIPCGIGLLFTMPWLIGSTYSAFAQITNCDQPDEVNAEMFDFMAGKKEERS
ncbi:MAG: hypothetical protein JNM14_03255 [Ferruginibacter sp.]|nr:hypothetical protein [Ferruginibacter sp.]